MVKSISTILKYSIFFGLGLILALPLFINNQLIFPYITPRAFLFRAIVEIIFLLYLLLACLDKKYLPRFSILGLALVGFIFIAFISSFLGRNFSLSFWGDLERSEGLILWLHLLTYFFVLTNVLREKKSWLIFFDISLAVSFVMSLFGLAQVFSWFNVSSEGGIRISGLLGNAAFFAAYLLFEIAFAAYMFFQRKEKYYKAIYVILFLLFSYLLIKTLTRGAMLGLIAGLGFAALLLLINYRENKYVKYFAVSLVSIFIIFSVGLYFGRQSDFVKNVPVLQRLASISLNDSSTRNRLLAWEAGLKAWTHKPVLGYGLENFTGAFDLYFPPAVYEDEGSQVWFDRAHNVLVDKIVTTGILGLVAYLFLVFYPIYLFIKKKGEGKKELLVFGSLIVAFFVQNLFVFETLTTYFVLIFAWSFFAVLDKNYDWNQQKLSPKFLWILFVPALISGWFVIERVNIQPAKASALALSAMTKAQNADDFNEALADYKEAIALNTYGTPEFLIYYSEFVGNHFVDAGVLPEKEKQILLESDQETERLMKLSPNDTMSYLVAMRHYNYTFASIPGKEVERLNRSLEIFNQIKEFSPTRPQIYREAGYTYVYLYRYYKHEGAQNLADESAKQAEELLLKSIELNPKVVETHIDLVMLYLNTNNLDKVKEVIKQMDEEKVAYQTPGSLKRLFQLAVDNQRYDSAVIFAEKLSRLDESNIDNLISLSITYAYAGQNDLSIQTAEKVKKISPDISAQVDQFIAEVKVGNYKIE